MRIVLLVALAVLALTSSVGSAELQGSVKLYSHFTALDPGSIRPQGWIRTYTQTIADGWPLLYAKERVPIVYDQFWKRRGPSVTADFASYFADGIIRLSEILPLSELAKEKPVWMKQVLDAQEADGYLGGYPKDHRWGNGIGDEWLEIFSQSNMLQALLYEYQCRKDASILNACQRSADLIIQAYHRPEGEVRHSIFSGHGVIIIRAMRDLYAITGKKDYSDFSLELLNKYCRDLQRYKVHSMACEGAHAIVETEDLSFPATVYEMTGDEELLKASIASWDMVNQYIMVDGQPTAAEAIKKIQPRVLEEHCGSVEWPITNNIMLRLTGDVRYADAAERAIFNAYPGAKSPDTLTLGYMHRVNELVAAEWGWPMDLDRDNWITRTYFTTAHMPLCCNVNSPRAMPHFIDNMALRSPGGGLVVAYYGPAKIEADVAGAGNVELVMATDYPFEDTVRITVNPDKDAPFPIELRVPGWCSSAKIELNGKPAEVKAEPGKFATVQGTWHKGDTIVLTMDVPVKLVDYPEGPLYAAGTAVLRGPLTYVLPVEEDWQRFTDMAAQVYREAHDKEHLSFRVMPRKGAIWNYALIVDKAHPEKSFTLKRFADSRNGVLWKDYPLGLTVKARKVLNWEIEGPKDHPNTPNLPYKPMKLSKRIDTVTLVPFGCTRLRMSYLPTTDH